MLSFFRKYQKGFFIFTTVVIVASFTFFGTSGLGSDQGKVKEKVIARGAAGSKITQEQVERMKGFIACSQLDLADEKITSPNWLNTGVLEKNFLQRPLGALLAKETLEEIRPDLNSAVNRVRTFQSYRHPLAPFLAVEGIWGQFAPTAKQTVSHLAATMSPGVDTFEQLAGLYLQHRMVSTGFIKKVMSYQRSQDGRIPEDKGLANADLSLVGLHYANEWFGGKYLSAAAEVILHGADFARSKGMNMSLSKARELLLQNLQEGAKRSSQTIEEKDLYSVFLKQVRNLGLEERECLALYRDVVLFERAQAAASSSLVIDKETLQEFHQFAKEQARLEVFSLPEALQVKDFTSLLKLQVYINAINELQNNKGSLAFPVRVLSVAEIAKKMPALVQRDYELEFARVSIKKAATLVGLKETWNWQVSDKGWDSLHTRFASLGGKEVSSTEERFVVLERLDTKSRAEIDQFSREMILSADKLRIAQILGQMKVEKENCSISRTGDGLPLQGITQRRTLVNLLEEAALQGDTEASDETKAAKSALAFYSEDGDVYYTIEVVQRAEEPRVVSFKEANASGLLTQLLDKKLEIIYPKVRKKNASTYLTAEGKVKPIAEVREQLGFALFPDMIKSVQVAYGDYYGSEPSKEQKEDPFFYVKHRMLVPMQVGLAKAKEEVSVEADSLLSQWEMEKKELVAEKGNKEFFKDGALFFLEEGSFSPLLTQGQFFKLVERAKANDPSLEDAEELLLPLRIEAEKKQAKALLEGIKARGGFHFQEEL